MQPVYPSAIILEVSAVCNLNCLGCAVHGPERITNRQLGVMPERIWRKVITEVGMWDREVNLICHGAGEPLLHRNLRDILTYAKSFPKIKTGFLTNGMLLDPDWSDFIVAQGIDWISFSIDGVRPDTHRLVRPKSDLNLIEKNLLSLIEKRKTEESATPTIGLNMVAYTDILDQREPFVLRWIDKVESVLISHYRNPPSSRRWPIVPVKRKPCFLLWRQMFIGWDGRAGLCCEDFNIDCTIGNIDNDVSILEMWNGEPINDVRKMHLEGRYHNHPLCGECDTWADDLIYEGRDPAGYKIRCRASQTEYMRE